VTGGSRRGVLFLPWLLVVLGLLVVALAVLLLAPAPEPLPQSETLRSLGSPGEADADVSNPPAAPLAPAELSAAGVPPLPGEGDLRVELRFRGAGEPWELPDLPGVLTGTVRTVAGEPLPGARLTLVGGLQDGRFTVADAEGRYRFDHLLPGTVFVRVVSPRHPPVERMQRVLARAATRRDFVLADTQPVEIRVLDHEGKPLAGAEVLESRGLRSARTDDEGVAVLADVPGGPRVVVDLRAEGHVPVRYQLNVHPGLLAHGPVELPPLPQGGTLRVRVRSWPGGPPPRVTVVPRATGPGPFLPAWELWQDVPVGREGLVTLEDVPTTHLLDVRVFHPSGVADPVQRSVRPNPGRSPALATFTVRSRVADVSGRVVDESGRGLPGARLVLEALRPAAVLARLYPGLAEAPTAVPMPVPGPVRRLLRTEADGAFRFAVADHPQGTGPLVLTASAPGRVPQRVLVRTANRRLTLTLPPVAPDAALTLVRRDGGTLPTARWFLDGVEIAAEPGGSELPEGLEGEARDWLAALLAAARRSPDGQRVTGLAPGVYEVVVLRGGVPLGQWEAFEVRGDATLDLSPVR